MASIRQHGEKWRAQVYVRGVRESAVFRTQREAKAWAAARELALKTPADLRYTVDDLLTRYKSEVSARKEGARMETLRIDATLRDHPQFAARRLADVCSADIIAWRDRRLQSVSPATVHRESHILRAAFNLARLEWGWLKHNPWEGVRIPAASPPRTRLFHWREIRRIVRNCGYAPGTAPQTKTQEVALALLLALRTGMRAQEVLSLGRDNIDVTRRIARVEHKMQYQTGAPRLVPLSGRAMRLLAPVLQREQIFTLSAHSLDALFRKVRDRLMLHDLHFHDSRATALTHLARRVPVEVLAKISGHKNIAMLVNVYYRERPEEIAARLR